MLCEGKRRKENKKTNNCLVAVVPIATRSAVVQRWAGHYMPAKQQARVVEHHMPLGSNLIEKVQ